jgi:phosphoribosylformimino-5-aminoimidazole carboxamide ribotide isomerase
MRILPVLDLLGGCVVRGVAGQRDEYRPVESQLVEGAEPRDVANVLRETFGFTEFYVADLDAILHDQPALDTYRRLVDAGLTLMVDCGLRDLGRATAVLDSGADAIIAGLETLPDPRFLQDLVNRFGPERVIFSLDLQQGQPLGEVSGWESPDPLGIATEAVGNGVARMIVLDLAGVGIGKGVPTSSLCRQLRTNYANLEIITGGGVRTIDDIRELAKIGVNGVLVASSLHDGRISSDDVANL